MFGAAGHQEILLLVLVVFLLFGASRLPTVAKNLAKGIVSFKRNLRDIDIREDINNAVKGGDPGRDGRLG